MAFIEQRLLDRLAYGTQGGPTWATLVTQLRSGIERRKAQRTKPLYRYLLLYQNLRPEHHEEVLAAFNACRGQLHGFRIKDWSDYEAANELLSIGTGVSQEVQLQKAYTFGSESMVRLIRKPVAGTVSLTANDSPLAFTIDTTTGVVTFTATVGHVIRWSGQFDVPVRFEQDDLLFAFNNRSAAGLALTADVGLREDLSA